MSSRTHSVSLNQQLSPSTGLVLVLILLPTSSNALQPILTLSAPCRLFEIHNEPEGDQHAASCWLNSGVWVDNFLIRVAAVRPQHSATFSACHGAWRYALGS